MSETNLSMRPKSEHKLTRSSESKTATSKPSPREVKSELVQMNLLNFLQYQGQACAYAQRTTFKEANF